MLKDLFFNIWYDSFGDGWVLLIIVLFLFCLAFLVFSFARIKAKNEKFTKKHLIPLSLILIIMYQAVPVSIDVYAAFVSVFDIKKAIQIEQIAINTSVIPWQKGGYYCKLAGLYNIDKNYKAMHKAYDTAYKYLKSYKAPCWGISFLYYYTIGNYDAAIEMAKNVKVGRIPPNLFISHCYLIKGEIKNAELYVDKDIQKGEDISNLATKAYILKVTGKSKNAAVYYQKAKQLCKDDKEKKMVEEIYKNFVEYENNRLNLLRKQRGLE